MRHEVQHLGNRFGNRATSKARAHSDKVQLAAKAGWAAKGGLYVALGILALMAAFGEGGTVGGGQSVIQWVAAQPFGTLLLVVAGVGFVCYALWRFVQAALDPESHDGKGEMVVKRVGWAASGLVHVSLAVACFQIVSGTGSGQGQQKQMWLSQALRESWGPLLVGVLGVFVIGVGLYQFKKALKLAFMEDVRTSSMSQRERDVFRLAGRIGLTARGVVFPIIGYFLVKAAVNANPDQADKAAKGVGGALHEIAQAGAVPLAIIAFGLAAYGVLQLFFARYRTVRIG